MLPHKLPHLLYGHISHESGLVMATDGALINPTVGTGGSKRHRDLMATSREWAGVEEIPAPVDSDGRGAHCSGEVTRAGVVPDEQ